MGPRRCSLQARLTGGDSLGQHYQTTKIKGPDNPKRQLLPTMSTKCCSGDGEGKKDKGGGGGSRSKTKLCVCDKVVWENGVCDKVVCESCV